MIASYIVVFRASPDTVNAMWGGLPAALLPFYQANMIWGTAGYFIYTLFFLFRMTPGSTRFTPVQENRLLLLFYALILFPSAAWTPLALNMVAQPSAFTWLIIRLVLFLVGAGSLGLLFLLLRAWPKKIDLFYLFAVFGSIGFCLQTAVLDAFIWPYYFIY